MRKDSQDLPVMRPFNEFCAKEHKNWKVYLVWFNLEWTTRSM